MCNYHVQFSRVNRLRWIVLRCKIKIFSQLMKTFYEKSYEMSKKSLIQALLDAISDLLRCETEFLVKHLVGR